MVPSKFFGALAVGRPVLFVGSPHSSVAGWIKTYGVGWVLTPNNEAQIVAELNHLAEHPEELPSLFKRCHRAYQLHFSKSQVVNRAERELRELINLADTALEPAGAEKVA